MTRRRFGTIVAIVAAANIALLFGCGFGAIGGGAVSAPNGGGTTFQAFSRAAVNALLVPAIWLFTPTENTSVIVGGSVILANSLLWGIIVAVIWTFIQKHNDASF